MLDLPYKPGENQNCLFHRPFHTRNKRIIIIITNEFKNQRPLTETHNVPGRTVTESRDISEPPSRLELNGHAGYMHRKKRHADVTMYVKSVYKNKK